MDPHRRDNRPALPPARAVVRAQSQGLRRRGLFWVKGRGYAEDVSSRSWAVGAGAGARVSLERAVLSPWIALDTMVWPGRHTIAVENIAETRSIPSLDLLVSLGFSLRLR